MGLNPLEQFAFARVFSGTGAVATAVREGLAEATVIERESTGVGFFTTVRLPRALPKVDAVSRWEWDFAQRDLPSGGCFMAWCECDDVLVLEGVTHGGNWPIHFDAARFLDPTVERPVL